MITKKRRPFKQLYITIFIVIFSISEVFADNKRVKFNVFISSATNAPEDHFISIAELEAVIDNEVLTPPPQTDRPPSKVKETSSEEPTLSIYINPAFDRSEIKDISTSVSHRKSLKKAEAECTQKTALYDDEERYFKARKTIFEYFYNYRNNPNEENPYSFFITKPTISNGKDSETKSTPKRFTFKSIERSIYSNPEGLDSSISVEDFNNLLFLFNFSKNISKTSQVIGFACPWQINALFDAHGKFCGYEFHNPHDSNHSPDSTSTPVTILLLTPHLPANKQYVTTSYSHPSLPPKLAGQPILSPPQPPQPISSSQSEEKEKRLIVHDSDDNSDGIYEPIPYNIQTLSLSTSSSESSASLLASAPSPIHHTGSTTGSSGYSNNIPTKASIAYNVIPSSPRASQPNQSESKSNPIPKPRTRSSKSNPIPKPKPRTRSSKSESESDKADYSYTRQPFHFKEYSVSLPSGASLSWGQVGRMLADETTRIVAGEKTNMQLQFTFNHVPIIMTTSPPSSLHLSQQSGDSLQISEPQSPGYSNTIFSLEDDNNEDTYIKMSAPEDDSNSPNKNNGTSATNATEQTTDTSASLPPLHTHPPINITINVPGDDDNTEIMPHSSDDTPFPPADPVTVTQQQTPDTAAINQTNDDDDDNDSPFLTLLPNGKPHSIGLFGKKQ
ncbi:MAG: hypothetical protein ACR2PX_21820 [Endozoicomonas sp.]